MSRTKNSCHQGEMLAGPSSPATTRKHIYRLSNYLLHNISASCIALIAFALIPLTNWKINQIWFPRKSKCLKTDTLKQNLGILTLRPSQVNDPLTTCPWWVTFLLPVVRLCVKTVWMTQCDFRGPVQPWHSGWHPTCHVILWPSGNTLPQQAQSG